MRNIINCVPFIFIYILTKLLQFTPTVDDIKRLPWLALVCFEKKDIEKAFFQPV
jgi:hypothetical protein